ncbi:hypothetical protein EVAR_50727_1 [Eumeta japonica]|uniref:Uncharacterized protein n=1 Tax=Eumeta variegata TaxID=151549 RepID=A0A4C1YM55_EUMVA|nr:hypothetical protein EVAR_50727_1 [Eumeta japonica]
MSSSCVSTYRALSHYPDHYPFVYSGHDSALDFTDLRTIEIERVYNANELAFKSSSSSCLLRLMMPTSMLYSIFTLIYDPYHTEYTDSSLITEVKQRRYTLGWVTA